MRYLQGVIYCLVVFKRWIINKRKRKARINKLRKDCRFLQRLSNRDVTDYK